VRAQCAHKYKPDAQASVPMPADQYTRLRVGLVSKELLTYHTG